MWQLRAHKLSGRRTSFPVGPKDDFDWSKACLEMEQLIGLWTPQEDQTDGQEQKKNLDDLAPAVAGGVYGEVAGENPVEMQVDSDGAAEVGDENMPVSSHNGAELTTSTSSSPLDHIVLPSGHIADVNCVLLLGGEGALCASGSRDRNVNLWDLRQGSRGTLLRTVSDRGFISTHRGWVWCLASSGPLLASGSFDSTVRLWDLAAGGAPRGLIRSKAAVLCLSCEEDTVLAGSHDQKLSIYDTRGKSPVGQPSIVAFFTYLLSFIAAEPLVKSLRLHSDAVLCLASDDQFILTGSKDKTIALYDRRAGKLLQKVQVQTYTGSAVQKSDFCKSHLTHHFLTAELLPAVNVLQRPRGVGRR